ncbi:MAG: DUF6036 family nucleotidyltransferase [Elusimicrobiota bacterium]
MLTTKEIRSLFAELNVRLAEAGMRGEIGIVGGAAMCLVYNARESTRDVDAVFAPAGEIRAMAARIAQEKGIGKDWLNDAVKGYIEKGFEREIVLQLSHLHVWTPEPRYLLAMKCVSARFDSHDGDDIRFLIRHLGLRKIDQVLSVIEKYYPRDRVPAKTSFFLEEVIEGLNDRSE